MELPDLKALKKLIKLCRAEGVKTVRVGELELHLGDTPAPARPPKGAPSAPGNIPEDPDPWQTLTEEEKLLWSSLPRVDDAPESASPALPSELRTK
jgi:hypothetical protein